MNITYCVNVIISTYLSFIDYNFLFFYILVFNANCSGACNCSGVYDGSSDLLLNIDNRYMVHYSLLYEYSELMVMSRNTLQGFIR